MPDEKAQYKHKIIQFVRVRCVFLGKAMKMFSVLRLYRSAGESLIQKMRVREMKDIQKAVCFEMEYFFDYSFDFASA